MHRLIQSAGIALGVLVMLPAVVAAETYRDKVQAEANTMPVVEHDAETTGLLESLSKAKAAGDANAARAIEEALGWHAVGRPAEEPARCRLTVRSELAGGSSRWIDNDVLVSDPTWSSGNPAMAVRSDGTLYVVVDDLDESYLDIYESHDDGQMWTYTVSIAGGEDLREPAIAIGEGEANRLLVVYEYGRTTADAAIMLYWLDLDTEDADQIVLAAEAAPFGPEAPEICVDSPEYTTWYPYVTYSQPSLGLQDWHFIQFCRSTDYGSTWTAVESVAWGPGGHHTADIDFGGGTLYIACSGYGATGVGDDIYLTSSTNYGSSWSPAVSLANTERDERDPRVAVTNDGTTIVVPYMVQYDTDTDVEQRFSTDSGVTWQHSFWPYVVGVDEFNADVCVSFGAGGLVHGTFWRSFSGMYGDVLYMRTDQTVPYAWSVPEVVNFDHSAVPWGRPTVAASPTRAEEGCVAWGDFRGDPVRGVYFDGTYLVSAEDIAPVSTTAGIDATPNPFNPRVRLTFELPEASAVTLRIHDVVGRTLRVLERGRMVGAGCHEVWWDGRDADGAPLSSGVYHVALTTESGRHTEKVVLLK